MKDKVMKIENAETRVIKWESLKWWWIKKRKMERERERESNEWYLLWLRVEKLRKTYKAKIFPLVQFLRKRKLNIIFMEWVERVWIWIIRVFILFFNGLFVEYFSHLLLFSQILLSFGLCLLIFGLNFRILLRTQQLSY